MGRIVSNPIIRRQRRFAEDVESVEISAQMPLWSDNSLGLDQLLILPLTRTAMDSSGSIHLGSGERVTRYSDTPLNYLENPAAVDEPGPIREIEPERPLILLGA